ncbi:glycoside hydrolase family 5 protein [Bosea sp. PAMC 26642]|uniref:glycoside hydrolase family 5 protein n=1 Tax=Bosea sp. (strain PAMC 26642) TaxID=1792307 RepID=UPI00076FF06D|nr:cellulase family glycosylhydrolase [Bosea sp. PAMC 26642]AMJ59468.1 hypothetical protein AXW83_03360 [Bosea sp. PAMC 26642]
MHLPPKPSQPVLLWLIALAAMCWAPFAAATAAPQPLPPSISEGLARGVNLVFGWYDTDSYKPREFDAELPLIRAAGAGHVRLPISMDIIEDRQSGTLRADRWADLRAFVAEATKNQLVTIIDMHNTGQKNPDGSWNEDFMGGLRDPGLRQRHLQLMTELASRANKELDRNWIVLQPANEPIFKTDPQIWYDHQDQMIPAMRQACPDCVIFVAGHNWQAPAASMSHLKPRMHPWWDARLILDLHLYSPLQLTHCSYPRQPNTCPGKTWPGSYAGQWLPVSGSRYFGRWNRKLLERELGILFAWAKDERITLHFSEIGTTADLDDRIRGAYLQDLTSVLSDNRVGYSCYEWNKNFGIKDHPTTLKACLAER